MTEAGKTLWVRSMYGAKNREPLVAITMPGGETLQCSPAEARAHALAVLECAEAADQDAFIFEFGRSVIAKGAKDGDRLAAGLMNEFRQWREKRAEKGKEG